MDRCPHCGYRLEGGESSCPLCGTEVGSSGEEERPAVGDGEAPVPWEDPDEPFAGALWRSWTRSLLSPGRFFSRISGRVTFLRPLLYFLVMTVTGAFFVLLWEALLGAPYGVGEGREAFPLLRFFLSPFVGLLGLGITTLLCHLVVLLVAPGRRGVGATARVLCYSSGPSLLLAVPFVGVAAAAIWTLVLEVVGIRAVHRTTTLRAVAVVLGPILVGALVAGAVLLAAVAVGPEPPLLR